MENIKQLLEQLGFVENDRVYLPTLSQFETRLYKSIDFKDGLIVLSKICKYKERMHEYTNFITQPLTKGMFLPCDEEGNVLYRPKDHSIPFTEPDKAKDFIQDLEVQYAQRMEQYQQALDRVLFEGAKVIINSAEYSDHIEYNGYFLCYINSDKVTRHKTIEQAINNNVKLYLK